MGGRSYVILWLMVLAFGAFSHPLAHAEITVTQEWEATYDSMTQYPASADNLSAMTIGHDGNIYVTGVSNADGIGNFLTVSYDPDGNERWVARYAPPKYVSSIPAAIVTDQAGNVYVTGISWGSFLTVSYDSFGNERWAANYKATSNSLNQPNAMTIDDVGNIYVTGYSSINKGGGVTQNICVTVAYDSSGNQLWVAHYDGAGSRENAGQGITVDDQGTIYVLAYTVVSYGNMDFATIAYDDSGNELWVARYDGPIHGNDFPKSITSSGENIYVTGASLGNNGSAQEATIAYDSSGNELWTARHNMPGYGKLATSADGNIYVMLDIGIVVYDPLGNKLWETPPYPPYDQRIRPRDMTVDQAGNVYISGPISGGTLRTKGFDSSGNLLWVANYKPEGYNLYAGLISLATDNKGSVYVAGKIQLGGNYNLTDYLTVKYAQAGLNNPPLADAGPDQTVECAGPPGSLVTLDGSGSTDPDNDQLTYTWSGPFGTATGATPSVLLPYGVHSVTLTVDDGLAGSSTDTVLISIANPPPPLVSFSLSGKQIQTGLYLSDVLFAMSTTDICSGVRQVNYELDGQPTSVFGSSAQVTITTGGDHSLVFAAKDYAGNVSAAESLTFTLFEANASGIGALIDHFLAQGLIEPQMENSLKQQISNGSYGAFINHIEAQSGKKLDPAVAEVLSQAAQLVMGN